MGFLKLQKNLELDVKSIDHEILKLKKELFNLRLKKINKQKFKSHSLKYIRCRIRQLSTIQNQNSI
jgi:ribosomal protein L29|uniref:ribosomal protein L29 n=1 Tax=Fibrocapsa japonica TaxID=94617 RepID=UPI0021143FEA|nr:ribosomal protein L29 [Fibrocapsa japonica]UTE95151.1 ribosomal protein L29 [Fibrocapsa japonica]